jgi:uncharacterized protein
MMKSSHLKFLSWRLCLGLLLTIAATATATAEVQISDRLVMASELGDVKEVTGLLEKGANPNALDSMGRTALMTSAIAGNIEIVRLLLERGADVNTPNAQGGTALVGAIVNSRPEIFHLLLAKRAAVDGYSNNGFPLIFACVHGRTEFAKVLLERGAQVQVKDEFGRTPLGTARKIKNAALVAMLESHGAKE